MDAVTLTRRQQEGVHGVAREVIEGIAPDLWLARSHADASPLGFVAWHIAATRDWAIHTWIRDVPEVRTRPKFAAVNPSLPPFGMTADEAHAIASAVTRDDVLAYLEAVQAELLVWLDTLTPGDLERVADTRKHGTSLSVHQVPGYLAEVDDMYDLAAWQVLSGACFGHVRGHIGEIELSIAMLRAQEAPRK